MVLYVLFLFVNLNFLILLNNRNFVASVGSLGAHAPGSVSTLDNLVLRFGSCLSV